MCQSVNKVILIGFLGEAPELKFSSQGNPAVDLPDLSRAPIAGRRRARSEKRSCYL
jgi:single-stranded DNA-binding protein